MCSVLLYFLFYLEAYRGSAFVEACRGSYCHLMVQVTNFVAFYNLNPLTGTETFIP